MAVIFEVCVSDGIRRYFATKVEADFFANDTLKCGFSVRRQEIPVPKTPEAFTDFMEDQFAQYRKLILAAAGFGA